MGSVCCFIGHREIEANAELEHRIAVLVERLIVEEQVEMFLFGSKSRFNSLCYEVVTRAKEKYPHVRRVYVRAEFPDINEEYADYLAQRYEETYFPQRLLKAGRGVYIQRNREMIDNSHICVFCYRERAMPADRQSGTASALAYASRKGKQIYQV